MAEKFEKLKMGKKPKLDKSSKLSLKYEGQTLSSFQFYQKAIFPLKRKNTLAEKMAKPPVPHAKWFFKLRDYVQVVNGDFSGQKGEVIQYFSERNVVIVKGLINFRTDVPALQIKGGGIYSNEACFNYNDIKHIGYETATIKCDSTSLTPDHIKQSIFDHLHLCEYCSLFNIVWQSGPFFTFSLFPPNDACANSHEDVKSLSQLKVEDILPGGTAIEKITQHTHADEKLSVRVIKVPEVQFAIGQRVISMLDEHFGRKGVVENCFQNEIYVLFDGETDILGPFDYIFFKLYQNGQIIENHNKSVYLKRVIVVNGGKDIFPFTFLPFPQRRKEKSMFEQLFSLAKDKVQEENLYLNTDLAEAKKSTYTPFEN